MAMKSCLYECTILHERHSPKHYGFKHKIFMFYLDLDDLDNLGQISWLLGHHQNRVYDYREKDHISDIRSYLGEQGVANRVYRIKLLTNLRSFGHIFNPVSFYFCFDELEQPVCVVVEIGNTFGELKYFYLGPEKCQKRRFSDQLIKYYYISPFTDLDNVLDFNIKVPDENLNITIDVLKNESKFFYSSMIGKRKEVSTGNLLWYTLKFPFVTLKVIFLIHWHAAVLHFIKKINYHPKEDNPQLQREVHREWSQK